MDTSPELLNRLFTAKADRRRELARSDFAEKIRMLIRLQQMAADIAKTRGKILAPWPTPAARPEQES